MTIFILQEILLMKFIFPNSKRYIINAEKMQDFWTAS